MTKYVLLDTNIFVRFVTQGNPGCEIEYWDRLKDHIDRGSAQLLISEVVKLETEGQLHDIKKEIEDHIATYIDKFSKIVPWNELYDLKSVLLQKCKEWRTQKITDVNQRIAEVDSFFQHRRAIQVTLNAEVMLLSKRRMLRRKGPTKTQRMDGDVLIINSLHQRFGKMSSDECILFCTENIKHFGVSAEKVDILHPNLKEELAFTQLFSNLQALIAALDDPTRIIPPNDEAINKAVEEEEAYPYEVKELFRLMIGMGSWEFLRT